MAWDIHGERLEPGHCEVHPWVHQTYPCHECTREGEEYRMREQHDREQQEAYYAQEWAHEAAAWFDPNHPVNK